MASAKAKRVSPLPPPNRRVEWDFVPDNTWHRFYLRLSQEVLDTWLTANGYIILDFCTVKKTDTYLSVDYDDLRVCKYTGYITPARPWGYIPCGPRIIIQPTHQQPVPTPDIEF